MRGHATPRVSMAVPVYNGERYLGEALDSLLAQTYHDFELIICDNASTDGTGEIARSYASMDRSEEHTSELQSHSDLVCRLLLEKKKKEKLSLAEIVSR